MERTRQRVKHACSRCRAKKSKCDGQRVCDRCQIDNAVCDYSQEAGHQRSRTSSAALLEAQNRQLADTVQRLYEYVRTGHDLPVLPARSTGDDRPLLHDIVAYVNTLPMEVTSKHEQVQYQMPRPKKTLTVSPQSQPETSTFPAFVGTFPQQDALMALSMQQNVPLAEYGPTQMNYGCLENRLNLHELWPLMETDPAEAARLHHWL